MSEPDVSNITSLGAVVGGAVVFIASAWGVVYRFIKSHPEPAKHIMLEEASLADTRPLYILLERNVVAVERSTHANERTAEAMESMLVMVGKRLTDDEIDRKANEKAEDRFERFKSDFNKGERQNRRES